MEETKDCTQQISRRKLRVGSSTRSVLGPGPAGLESSARLDCLAQEVERQIAICGTGEPASSDATVTLLRQMGLEYRSDLAEFADGLESVTSCHFNSLRAQV